MLQLLIESMCGEVRSATIDSFDPKEFEFLEMDEQQLSAEVTRIAESDAFQRLQSEANRQMVHRRSIDAEEPCKQDQDRKDE
jgi:hypothetical protein